MSQCHNDTIVLDIKIQHGPHADDGYLESNEYSSILFYTVITEKKMEVSM